MSERVIKSNARHLHISGRQGIQYLLAMPMYILPRRHVKQRVVGIMGHVIKWYRIPQPHLEEAGIPITAIVVRNLSVHGRKFRLVHVVRRG